MPEDKPIRGDEPYPIPYRDPERVDRIVGKRRAAVQVGTGFWEWPIWQRYPTWHQFNEQIAAERAAALKEGRAPHPSVAPPPGADNVPQNFDNEMIRLRRAGLQKSKK